MSAPNNFSLPGLKIADATQAFKLVLLCGLPFSGKTTAALTFPNPIILDGENKVPAGAPILPFLDDAYVDSLKPRANKNAPPNRRDVLLHFISAMLPTFPADSTFILDSLSAVDGWYHRQTEDIEGVTDLRQIYGRKLKYFNTLFELLRAAKCSVIVTAHMQPLIGENEKPTGAYKAFIGGSFAEKLPSFATMVLRTYVDAAKPQGERYRFKIKPDGILQSTGVCTAKQLSVDDVRADYKSLVAVL
jgi:hypothetical protein